MRTFVVPWGWTISLLDTPWAFIEAKKYIYTQNISQTDEPTEIKEYDYASPEILTSYLFLWCIPEDKPYIFSPTTKAPQIAQLSYHCAVHSVVVGCKEHYSLLGLLAEI